MKVLEICNGLFHVYSKQRHSGPTVYIVEHVNGHFYCSCSFFEKKGFCWHIQAVKEFLERCAHTPQESAKTRVAVQVQPHLPGPAERTPKMKRGELSE